MSTTNPYCEALVGYGERGWYGNQEVYVDSFVRALTGELSPSGKLPVRVSDQYPIGSGGAAATRGSGADERGLGSPTSTLHSLW